MVKAMDLVKMEVFVWIISHIIRANVKQALPEKTAQLILMTAWIICARYEIIIFVQRSCSKCKNLGKNRISCNMFYLLFRMEERVWTESMSIVVVVQRNMEESFARSNQWFLDSKCIHRHLHVSITIASMGSALHRQELMATYANVHLDIQVWRTFNQEF